MSQVCALFWMTQMLDAVNVLNLISVLIAMLMGRGSPLNSKKLYKSVGWKTILHHVQNCPSDGSYTTISFLLHLQCA